MNKFEEYLEAVQDNKKQLSVNELKERFLKIPTINIKNLEYFIKQAPELFVQKLANWEGTFKSRDESQKPFKVSVDKWKDKVQLDKKYNSFKFFENDNYFGIEIVNNFGAYRILTLQPS